MSDSPNKLSQFWQELKRRKVVRVVTVYAAAAFVILALLIGLLVRCSSGNLNPEPTRWWGPYANGHYPDTGLLKEWPEEGPEILWSYDSLGKGFSSAVVQDGAIFITGMVDSTGYLYKLNMEGKLVYRVPYGLEWNGSYEGTRGSTTLVGEKGYLVSGRGKLVCFNTRNGEILWSKEYFEDFGGENISWGIAETPVVNDDIIYATPGGSEYNVVALNRHSGELVWACEGEGGLSAYCTPLLFDHKGRKLLTTYTAKHLLGIDAETGELLWSLDVPREHDVHLWTPIYHKGEIYFPTGNETGGGKLKLSEDGSSKEVVWKNQVNDYRASSILVDGYLYESYDQTRRLTWRCTDWITGKEMYATRDLGVGRGFYADGMLYFFTYKHELALVKPDHSELKIVSKIKVEKGTGLSFAQPVLHEGIIYVRHGRVLIAYKVKG